MNIPVAADMLVGPNVEIFADMSFNEMNRSADIQPFNQPLGGNDRRVWIEIDASARFSIRLNANMIVTDPSSKTSDNRDA